MAAHHADPSLEHALTILWDISDCTQSIIRADSFFGTLGVMEGLLKKIAPCAGQEQAHLLFVLAPKETCCTAAPLSRSSVLERTGFLLWRRCEIAEMRWGEDPTTSSD